MGPQRRVQPRTGFSHQDDIAAEVLTETHRMRCVYWGRPRRIVGADGVFPGARRCRAGGGQRQTFATG